MGAMFIVAGILGVYVCLCRVLVCGIYCDSVHVQLCTVSGVAACSTFYPCKKKKLLKMDLLERKKRKTCNEHASIVF